MTEQSKKKVFICITKSNWGGAQKYVYDIATNIPREQFEVSVLLGGSSELKKKLDEAGVKTIPLKNSQRNINILKEFGLFFELFHIFQKEKPDIIHLNSSKMGGMGAFVGRIVGIKKIIFTGHGWAFNEDRPWWQKIFARFFHILTILLAHQTVAVSKITYDQIGKPWNKKMIVIRNGLRPIDFEEKTLAREFLSQKILSENPSAAEIFSKNPVWIGTISELHKTKGLNFAMKAIAKIPNVVFTVIGDGEEKKNLEQLIRRLKVEQKIFLLGRIESASMYLKAFDMFTLTSVTEALPYALLEAGAAELPIIASNVGGIPEIVENNETGILIRSKSSEEIQRAIEYVLENRKKIEIFGKKLKKKIDFEFSLKTMIEKTIAMYSM